MNSGEDVIPRLFYASFERNTPLYLHNPGKGESSKNPKEFPFHMPSFPKVLPIKNRCSSG